MGAAYGKKKAYSIDQEPLPKQQCVKNGKHPNARERKSETHEDHRPNQMDQKRTGTWTGTRTGDGDGDGGLVKSASAHADLQQHRSEGVHRKPSPVSAYVPQPDYVEADEDEDIIKPRKLVNPVKASKSHQELHRELLSSCKRVETKPELQRVLESRKRDQLMRQRRQEDEARKKVSPLEAELMKRHRKLEELERQQQEEDNPKAPEFVKVKENLRRTSFHSKDQEEV